MVGARAISTFPFPVLTRKGTTTRRTPLTPTLPRPNPRFPSLPATSGSYLILLSSPKPQHSSSHLHPLRCHSADGNHKEEEEEEGEAREAVASVLLEAGVAAEDAARIAAGCPAYLDVLLKGVREIDELALWGSWMGEGEGTGVEPSFREKVYSMAMRKGDRGVIPFLESIGIKSHSSATRIARYVSSQSVCELIVKVGYIKEILRQGSEDEGRLGRNARRMMTRLSIRADDDIQQTLSFFEKMEARRGGLDMLGSADACLPFLIESFPQLLLCSLENHLKPLFEFLEEIGVPASCIKNIIVLFPPVIFYDIKKDMIPKMQVLQKVGVQERGFGKVLLRYPWIMSRSILGNYESVLEYLEAQKVPKSFVDRAIKKGPYLLGCSISKMDVMVAEFRDLGVENKDLSRIILSSPQLLVRKQTEFIQVVSFLKEFGFENYAIRQILCRSPEIFASDVEKTLGRKVKILEDFGIPDIHLRRVIKKYPEVLMSDVEGNLLPRMHYLMEAGLSSEEVRSMVCRFSPLLGYSVEKVLKPKLEFLVKVMERPLQEVVKYPQYFSYSLETRIKPRYYLLKGRNMHSVRLERMLRKTNFEFGEFYMGLVRMLVFPSSTTTSQTAD